MTTFDLTANELRAALALVRTCLDGMGGSRPADLEYDEYTWVEAKDLQAYGYSRGEANSTFGSLEAKGMIQLYDKNTWCLTTKAWRWLDTQWDSSEYGQPTIVEIVQEATYLDLYGLAA